MTESTNGDVVFRIARHRGWTLQDLSDLTHIDRSTLSRVQSGKRAFTAVERVAVSVALALPMEMLFPTEPVEGIAV